jgi:hypothetical protein
MPGLGGPELMNAEDENVDCEEDDGYGERCKAEKKDDADEPYGPGAFGSEAWGTEEQADCQQAGRGRKRHGAEGEQNGCEGATKKTVGIGHDEEWGGQREPEKEDADDRAEHEWIRVPAASTCGDDREVRGGCGRGLRIDDATARTGVSAVWHDGSALRAGAEGRH